MTAVGEAKVEGLIASPVLAEVWTFANRFNQALRSAILKRREQGSGVAKSNLLGWQSDLHMLLWGGRQPQRSPAMWCAVATTSRSTCEAPVSCAGILRCGPMYQRIALPIRRTRIPGHIGRPFIMSMTAMPVLRKR